MNILVRDDPRRQEVVTTKRRRQVKLVGEVLFNLLAIAFGVLGLAVLIHHITTPELRNQPLDTTLDPFLGHTATFVFFAAFCLFIVVSALFFLRKSIRLLRNKAYLELEEPPFSDYR
jgi:hypothetical protein